MNIKELRVKSGLTQREFGERLSVQPQTILKYEKGDRNVPESIQKLIRYEFAEFLPAEERLATVSNGKATVENEDVMKLRQENEELKAMAQEFVHVKEQNSLLKRTVELLEDQIKMYKMLIPGDDKSKTA